METKTAVEDVKCWLLKVVTWVQSRGLRDTRLVDKQATWSLTLMGEYRLRVLARRVLRRICGPKRDDLKEGWRKLNNEELRNL
jgi:hypothetical protein